MAGGKYQHPRDTLFLKGNLPSEFYILESSVGGVSPIPGVVLRDLTYYVSAWMPFHNVNNSNNQGLIVCHF